MTFPAIPVRVKIRFAANAWRHFPGLVSYCEKRGRVSGDVFDIMNAWTPKRNGRNFADKIFEYISLKENLSSLIEFSLKFIPKGLSHRWFRYWLGTEQPTSYWRGFATRQRVRVTSHSGAQFRYASRTRILLGFASRAHWETGSSTPTNVTTTVL